MKLTVFIITIAFIQVSAAGFAQRISLKEQNTAMSVVLSKIQQQSGYDIFYKNKLVKDTKINISLNDVSLEIALKAVLDHQGLEFSIDDKLITIQKKEVTALDQITSFFRQDSLTFKGKVLDVYGQPLPGASVKVKGTKKATFTTKEGNFVIYAASDATLQVSYLGYETQELKLRREDAGLLRTFNMKLASQNLGEVAIVSTGYQDLPKERATGSFEVITAKQLEHSTNPNLVKRLEGITAGMDFGNPFLGNANLSSNTVKKPPLINVTIRGKNTLEAPGTGLDLANNSGQILVVIDGIPSQYNIDQINPDDVESINILKDAAAASIWGSRAANGVIVVKTKRGRFNRPATVSFNTSVNISNKIDLFYKKLMSASDFIDAQVMKYYHYHPLGSPVADPTDLYNPQPYLSPVEEIMNDLELGQLQQAEAKAKLDALRGNDARRDLDKYFLRSALTQNYSLSVDGGSERYAYRLSGGYSGSRNNTVPSGGSRYNLNYSVNLKPVKNLTLQGVLAYNESRDKNQSAKNPVVGSNTNTGFNPYADLADEQGNPLAIPYAYRPKYLQLIASHYGDKILDMSFKPLDDMNQGYVKTMGRDISLNLNANYRISKVFSGELTYGYTYGQNEVNALDGVNSFYTRELINIWTTREDYTEPPYGLPAPLRRLIPTGGIYSPTLVKRDNQILRGLLSADKTWNDKHQLSAVAFFDISQLYNMERAQQLYGYDEKTLQSNNTLPFGMEFYRLFSDPASGLPSGYLPGIPGGITDFRSRSLGLGSNAAYTYDRRYTFSASIRKDMSSSVAGPSTNKRGIPYISVGGLWNLANEKFYKVDWLPVLQLRATFGYNGNINASGNAKPVLSYPSTPSYGPSLLPYANLQYITNAKLRPELSRSLNLALNFGLKDNRLAGSVEYFVRNTTDLLTDSAVDPTIGYSSARYNTGSLRSRVVESTLNSINLRGSDFSWTSNLTFAYNRVKITKLLPTGTPTVNQLMGFDNVEGYELNRIAAYRWAGLDPQTGDPMGYDANGNKLRVTDDPNSPDSQNLLIIQSLPLSSAHYFGSALPVYYGAFRNTVNYKDFSLTVAFQYKLGYYFRKSPSDAIRYSSLFQNNSLGAVEYARRWQKSGDELVTNVPSLAFSTDADRDEFYRLSEINVMKADHIRFQEINLSYTFRRTNWFIKNPRLYANVNNLGILWRANKAGLDPEANDYPNPKMYSIGLSANF